MRGVSMHCIHASGEKSSFERFLPRPKNETTVIALEAIVKQLVKVRAHVLFLVCAVLLGPTSLPGAVAQSGAPAKANVTVFAGQYRFAGREFDCVEALGVAVEAERSRTVALDICGSGVTRALKAAVYRLRYRPLLVRVREMDEGECSAGAMLPAAARPLELGDEAAVESYWRGMAP
jgi:hypothetical protein